MNSKQIGLIGAGQMGSAIARRLLQQGIHVKVYDIDSTKSLPLAAMGATVANSCEETIIPGGLTLSMIPDDPALEIIAGCITGKLQGGIHLSLSSVSPEIASALHSQHASNHETYLSATVLGRPDVAEAGQLLIYLSGEENAKRQTTPLLQYLGEVEDLGSEPKAPIVAKLATNSLILSDLFALGAAASFVERFGLDRARFLRLVAKSPLYAGSRVYAGYGEMIGKRDYSDNKFPVERGLKDTRLILNAAKDVDQPMPHIQPAFIALLQAQEDERTYEDWSVLAEYAATRIPLMP